MRAQATFLALFLCTTAVSAAAPSTLTSKAGTIQLQVITDKLEHPWSLAFLPDGTMLVTERPGRLRYVTPQGTVSAPITGLPPIWVDGQGGLLDVQLDRDFASNHQLYFSFSQAAAGGNSTAVARATLAGPALTQVQTIFSQHPTVDSKFHFGGRIVQQASGDLFVTLGDRLVLRSEVQKRESTIGKVVHITPSGAASKDNPYLTDPTADARVWSLGHRNIQGATLDAAGRLWTHEHGPQGGDEINITDAGVNYGWPLITYGEEYGGGTIGPSAKAGLAQPLHYWVPSIAPSGMVFYHGKQFPAWQGDLLVGSLKFGLLVRLDIEKDNVVAEERIAIGKRVRDVKVGPDGAVYLLTDEDQGAILRLTPTAAQ